MIEPVLPARKRLGRPRTTALREVINAILYVLHSGGPCGLLPKDFRPAGTLYWYFVAREEP